MPWGSSLGPRPEGCTKGQEPTLTGIVGEESHPDEVDLRQQFGTPSFGLRVYKDGEKAKIFTINKKAALHGREKEKHKMP